MGTTPFLENAIGSHIFRTAAYAKPTELYVGLFLVDALEPTILLDEVSGGGYGRVQINPGDDNWAGPIDDNGIFFNLVNIEFPQQTTDWGLVGGWAIFDQGANKLLTGLLVEPVEILTTTAKGIIPPGYLQVEVS